jgi:hypothetical protein
LQRGDGGGGDGGDIPKFDKDAGLFGDDFRHPARVGPEARPALRHRLQEYQPETLALAGESE